MIFFLIAFTHLGDRGAFFTDIDMNYDDFPSILGVLSNLDRNDSQEFWSMWGPTNQSGNFEFIGVPSIIATEYFYDGFGNIQTFQALSSQNTKIVENVLCSSNKKYKGVLSVDNIFICIEQARQQNPGGIVLIIPLKLANQMLVNSLGCTFTKSEQRLLLQLLAGYDLKSAAKIDGVKYETKRSQLKGLLSKTGYDRQIDMVNASLAHLILSIKNQSRANGPVKKHDEFLQYCNLHLPKEIRHHFIVDELGDEYRFLDMGPRNGEPLLVLHPQILPFLSDCEIRTLHQLGLRLIWPMRNGALAPDDRELSFKDHLNHTLKGIELASNLFFEPPFAMVCLISSSYFGIEYALNNPSKLSHLYFVGACYKPVRHGNAAGRLRNGLIDLSVKKEWLMNIVLGFLAKKLHDVEKLETMLKDIYSISRPDLQVIEKEFQTPENIHFRFLKSVKSIRHDFYHQAFLNWEMAKSLKTPMTFIHGMEDQIHTIENITSLAKSLNARLNPIPECGQLAYMGHFNRILNIIKD